MNDTPAIVNTTYRQLLGHLTGEERLKFASESFEAAKVIIRSSLSGIDDELLLKKKMFLRLYGDDVDDSYVSEFFDHLSMNNQQSTMKTE
jgi:hypothetical protein